MSLLIRIVAGACCRSTHHRIVVDSLRFLSAGERWVSVFLRYHKEFLQGAKAPDDDFKDFRNHVLHVSENNWGGAPASARQWYRATVKSLSSADWPTAAYSAGVLSHYLTDPLMPLHTGQSESEGSVHRAIEWSICKSWSELMQVAESNGGYPTVNLSGSDHWLEDLIVGGAQTAHQSYNLLIDHFDPVASLKDPRQGMDNTAKSAVASLLTLAVISNARVLDRAIAEAGVDAPEIKLTVPTLLASVNMPARLVMNRLADRSDRAQVQAIVDEYQQTGKVIENLPADEKEVRELHAREVLHVSIDELNRMPARPAGTQHATAVQRTQSSAVVPTPNPEPSPAPVTIPVTAVVSGSRRPRHYLELHSPVVDAPSIGPKTADRLAEVRIATVGEFLDASPDELATALQTSYINPKLIRDWQDQARLAVQIPGVRGHDVQLLVAAQVRSVDQLLSMTPTKLLNRVLSVALTPAGQRILRDSQPPDLNEVEEWLRWSRDARMTPPPALLGEVWRA